MRIVLCGDMLFSSRNLAKRLSPDVVEILHGADAVFCNGGIQYPEERNPSRTLHVPDFCTAGNPG